MSLLWTKRTTSLPGVGLLLASSGGTTMMNEAGSFYRSTDGGGTWVNHSTGGTGNADGSVFVSLGRGEWYCADSDSELLHSVDDGVTWAPIAIASLPASYHLLGMGVGAGLLVAMFSAGSFASAYVSISSDGGVTWGAAANITSPVIHHGVVGTAGFDPVSAQFYFNGWDNSFGWNIFTSPDGVTWTANLVESIFTNQPTTYGYGFANPGGSGHPFLAGLQNGTDIRLASTLLGIASVSDLTLNPPLTGGGINVVTGDSTGALLVAADGTTAAGSATSVDGGTTWALDAFDPAMTSGNYFVGITYDSSHKVFIASVSGAVAELWTAPYVAGDAAWTYRSRTPGFTWNVNQSNVNPNTGTIVIGTFEGIERSTDGWFSYTDVTPGAMSHGTTLAIYAGGTTWYAVSSGSSGTLWTSTDDGATWTSSTPAAYTASVKAGASNQAGDTILLLSDGTCMASTSGGFANFALPANLLSVVAVDGAIIWDGAQFVAVGVSTAGGTNGIYTAPGGFSSGAGGPVWTLQDSVTAGGGGYDTLGAISYVGGTYILAVHLTAAHYGILVGTSLATLFSQTLTNPFSVDTDAITMNIAAGGRAWLGAQSLANGLNGLSTGDGATFKPEVFNYSVNGSPITMVYDPVHSVLVSSNLTGYVSNSPWSPPGAVVPDVTGEPLATAEADLIAAGFTIGTVTTAGSLTVPAGDVISTNPAGGTTVAPGSSVDIVESLGIVGVTVPDVTGEAQATAEADIVAAGLVVGTVTTGSDPVVPSGDVNGQFPVGGSSASLGDSVDINVSTGPATATVPNVVGISQPAAITSLSGVGLHAGPITFAYSNVVPTGFVISQDPVGGTTVPFGSNVAIVVSLGVSPVTVPDIVGDTLTDATIAIQSAQLAVGTVTAVINPNSPVGTVLSQFPDPGTLVSPGSFVDITSVAAFANTYDIEATVISQFANSPVILRLVNNMNEYVDQSINFVNFYNFIWNVDSAVGFGLDIWGRIVGVSRLLQLGTTGNVFGFENDDVPADWENFGGGVFYTGAAGTSYLLPDDPYRILILTKALANITATTSQALNQLLRNLFPGRGVCYVQDNLDMSMVFVFKFALSDIEVAILTNSGVLPHPAGVSFTIDVSP